MAPRLSRWIGMTLVGAALVGTLFLSTGGTPLFLLGVGDFDAYYGRGEGGDLLARRIRGTLNALERTKYQRVRLESEIALREALARTSADPVVLEAQGTRLVVDAAATAELEPVWRQLPARTADVRTVVIERVKGEIGANPSASVDSEGTCVVDRWNSYPNERLSEAIRSRAALCLFAETFGRPGRGMDRWVSGVRGGLAWQRYRLEFLYQDARADGDAAPEWWEVRPFRYGGLSSSDHVRLAAACVGGRVDRCSLAEGVTAAGWPQYGPAIGYSPRYFPHAVLPRDLLRSVGARKFGEIWRSDAPLAESFTQVTGGSMDQWIYDWAGSYIGHPRRDNALSLAGWAGVLVWLGLLGACAAVRFRSHTVS